MTDFKESPSQTAGPYVHIGMDPETAGLDPVFQVPMAGPLAAAGAAGQRIRVTGVIHDGNGDPVLDALIEVWQADANGVYNSPEDPRYAERDGAVGGWGRVSCDLRSGKYVIDTVKPGPVPGPGNSLMAPHLSLWIVARGVNIGLSTRVYFPDEAEANAADPILSLVEETGRQATLIAHPAGRDGDTETYRFDIRLQGDGETVFFDA